MRLAHAQRRVYPNAAQAYPRATTGLPSHSVGVIRVPSLAHQTTSQNVPCDKKSVITACEWTWILLLLPDADQYRQNKRTIHPRLCHTVTFPISSHFSIDRNDALFVKISLSRGGYHSAWQWSCRHRHNRRCRHWRSSKCMRSDRLAGVSAANNKSPRRAIYFNNAIKFTCPLA